MDNLFAPAVITSKAADRDYGGIMAKHANLVNDVATQKIRVDAYNQQKQAEMAAQNSMKMEIEKERMVADTAQKKDALTFQQKQSEIDVKRAALSLTGK